MEVLTLFVVILLAVLVVVLFWLADVLRRLEQLLSERWRDNDQH